MTRGIRGLLLTMLVSAVGAAVLAPGAWALDGPPLSASSAVLMEESTGQRLLGLAPDAPRPIASTTKLMTALITLEHVHRLGTLFTQNNYHPAAVDSQIGLRPGERMSVHDLLVAMMLPSADDAAEDLAYNIGGGSIERFVSMMNIRARQLGLTRTHYSTPIGLDTPGNYSSAADLARLTAFLLRRQPLLARIVALPQALLRTGDVARAVENRNSLVRSYPWINGVKTGHTSGAGYVLVTSATRGPMTLLSVVLGTDSESSRDANSLALLNYGFARFRLAQPLRGGQVLARPAVKYRPGARARLVAGGSFSRVIPRGGAVSLRVQAPRELAGPLPQGSSHGFVEVLVGGHVVHRAPLVLAQALPPVSPLTIAAHFLARPPTLGLLLLLLAVGMLGVVWRRRERTRAEVGPVQA